MDFSYFTDYYRISEKEAYLSMVQEFGYLGFISTTLASKGTYYERRAYSLFDLMSEMGGISSSILSIFLFLVGFYNLAIYKIDAV